ncbi:PrsW family glutamic-type intramembrane protease [Companilactobacillus insicii]|uniref:PrsW family glutamic-type intramembrane protease n=1 Tax=Companilactobacillus insicii TaxID=1732567 RepID=UPI000F7A59BB|nr:PrsW family intramembrane metalloprotease [Companilactobacillus insicii]
MKFCVYCGKEIPNQAKFCVYCGQQQPKGSIREDSQPVSSKSEGIYDMATGKLNSYTGGHGSVHVNLTEMFSEVFEHHTSEEAEKIFIAGTKYTTPDLDDTSDNWTKPWLFFRVLSYFSLILVVLLGAAYLLGGVMAVPGVMIVSALAVPFSAVIFYFECNAFQNISIFTVMKIYFIGGALSLLATMFLYQFAIYSNSGEVGLWSASVIGFVEELGKLIVIIYFVNKIKTNYILNGILIGGSVGAGFATFETAGYIYYSGDSYIITALLRAVTAIGSHLVWAAITGGAIMLLKKMGTNISFEELFDSHFLIFFGLSIFLHAMWDWTFIGWVKYIFLITVAWIILFVLMNAGINQVHALKSQS